MIVPNGRPSTPIPTRRWDWAGGLFLVAMVALTAFGLSHLQTNTEDVLQWLPDQSEARRDYDFFASQFQSDDFVIITWPGCRIEDPRLRGLANRLRQETHADLFAKVTTGYDVVRQLGDQLDLSRESIQQRLRGVFFGLENPELTCALIELSHAGTGRRSDAMLRINAAIEATPGLDRAEVSMAGYPYIATYIDQQLQGSYVSLLLPSVVLASLIALLCLRDVMLSGIVFLTAVGAATVSIAFAPACGAKLGGLMSIIPALVFVLTTSGAIHLIRYSLDVIGQPSRLLAIGWKPCAISTLTTAVGMLSLTRSDFPAIRNFGLYCASGVMFALAFQLVMVPWLLTRWGQPGLERLQRRRNSNGFWKALPAWIQSQRWLLAVLFLGLLGVGAMGVSRLTAEVEVEKLFRQDSEIIDSLTRLESQLAPMDQTEVLLVFDQPEASRMYQRANYTRAVQQALQEVPDVGVAFSLVNFLPRQPRVTRPRDLVRRSAARDYLDRERQRLADGGLLAIDPETGQEIWRISIRFPFTRDVDFERIRRDVEAATEKVARQYRQWAADQRENEDPSTEENPRADGDQRAAYLEPPRLVYSGHTYLFHHAQLTLLQDLFQNFLLAFVLITPLLMLVLGSIRLGLIAMLPNLFPTLVVFGGLGWLHQPVDLALAMTACVALGIAVDDTTHFLIRFCDHGGSLRTVSGPIRETLPQCGPAMLHTTLIASASLMTYYFSSMLVVSRFAWAISLLLVVALIADVFLLPAVLFLMESSRSEPE